MKTCISTQPVRLLCANKILSIFLAFLILVFSLLLPLHEAHAASSVGKYVINSSDPRDWFVSTPAQMESVFCFFSDYNFQNPIIYAEASFLKPGITTGLSSFDLSSFSEYGLVFAPNDSSKLSSSLRMAFKSKFSSSNLLLDDQLYTVTFSCVLIYNFSSYGVGSYPTADIVSLGLGNRPSPSIYNNYSITESYNPSSLSFLGSVTTSYGTAQQYSMQFSFVASGAVLSSNDYFIFDVVNSYPLSGVYINTAFVFDVNADNYIRLYDYTLDDAEKNASVIAGSIANIGSGTPPADFSGSGSALNNLDDQLAVFDDTYKVDTGAVDDNFSDAMTFVESFELTQGMGVVGDLITRFTSDNPIWLSILIFSLAFGLSLFTIGRGLSVSGRRNNSKRGGSS